MNEGWYGEDYLILFSESEAVLASERYAISALFPGYQVVGLSGWDNFILRDSLGHHYRLPTVPAVPQFLSQFEMPKGSPALRSDERFRGKIKWYIKPIVFGGDPNSPENLTWVNHEQHADLVKWWNKTYHSVKGQTAPARHL